MNKLYLVLGGMLAVPLAGIITLTSMHPAGLNSLDLKPPTLAFPNAINGLQSPESHFLVSAADSGAGISSLKVEISQGELKEIVATQTFNPPSKEVSIPVIIKRGTPNLREGKATIKVHANDASLLGNKTSLKHDVKVDYSAPQVEPLSAHHNGRVGGSLLVAYRVSATDAVASGVKVGDREFLGVPAHNLNPKIPETPGAYVVLFPIATSLDEDVEISLFARDDVGNVGRSSFYHSVKPNRFRDADLALNRTFFEGSITKLLGKYLELAKLSFREYDVKSATDEQLAADFTLINQDYRRALANILEGLSKQSHPKRLFEGVFIRPISAAPTSSFGERRSYTLNNIPAGKSIHLGIDLAHLMNAPVFAANKGRVLFAGDLGIYGTAVVIDHGMGLTSLYGHLSSTSVQEGVDVNQGAPIGRTGITGLAGGDHLHFEIRLHNVAVSPFEWLDPHWIQDHIELPTKDVLDVFVPQVPTPPTPVAGKTETTPAL